MVLIESAERRIEVRETLRRQDFKDRDLDRFGAQLAQSLTEFSRLMRSAGYQHATPGER
jgi:hypothetical protein